MHNLLMLLQATEATALNNNALLGAGIGMGLAIIGAGIGIGRIGGRRSKRSRASLKRRPISAAR